jgi:hypothetical protein
VLWNGNDFTLGAPSVTSVDEYRSPLRGLGLALAGWSPHARVATFLIDSPVEIAAKLEVFDAEGRRIATPFDGMLAQGHASVTWPLAASNGARVASGVYFARLTFAGGNRSVQLAVTR